MMYHGGVLDVDGPTLPRTGFSFDDQEAEEETCGNGGDLLQRTNRGVAPYLALQRHVVDQDHRSERTDHHRQHPRQRRSDDQDVGNDSW